MVVLGAVVLAVAIFALRGPRNQVAGPVASKTITETVRPSTPATGSAHSAGHDGTSGEHGRHGGSTASTPRTERSSRGGAQVRSVPLVVLNNTTTTGLAQGAAQRFEAGGWTVRKYANYTNNILSTCAYYAPADQQAKRAAQALQRQYPTIKRVKPKFDGLDYGPLVLILTPDYTP